MKTKIKPTSLSNINSKKITYKLTDYIAEIFNYIILLSIGYIVLYPLLYMVVSSIRTPQSYLDPTRNWIPTSVYFGNFEQAIKFLDFQKSLFNTIKYEMISAIIEVISCSIAAYGFARFTFKYKKLFTAILFITILVPAPMIIIPLVTNYSKMDIFGIFGLFNKISGIDLRLNIMGTPLTYWLPSVFGVGLRSGILIYIYIQFFKSLPKELEEAAAIDGAGPIRTFIKIALPSSSVVIITVTVFSLVWHWNDYFLASMYSVGEHTLAVATAELPLTIQAYGIWDGNITKGIILAGTTLYVIPLLIIYLFLQRGFIESVDRVGITG